MKLASHIAHERCGDAVVVVDLKAGQYFELNDSAGTVLELAGQSERHIAAQLSQRFDVEPETAARDAAQALSEFRALGWVSED